MNLSFLNKEIAPFNLYKVLWKFVLLILRIILIVIVVFISSLFTILQGGFLSDLAVTPWWLKAQRESQTYFAKLNGHRYQAGPLDFAAKDENAWGYYNRATQWVFSLDGEDQDVIDPHLYDHHKTTFADTERVVKRYARAFAIWDSGTACRYCAIPADYEKGFARGIPDYIGLQHLAELALVYAGFEILKGDTQKAAEIYAKVLKMGADVGGGEEAIIGQMVGVVIARKTETALKTNLNSFNFEAIVTLKKNLHQIESNWPRFDTALDAEGRSYLLPSSTGWDGRNLFEGFQMTYPWGQSRPIYIQIFLRISYSLLSWKRGFSGRLTAIATSRRVVDLAKRLRTVPKRDWDGIRPVLVKADTELERDARHWDITVIPVANFNRMDQRIYEALITLRVIEGGLRLREYKLKKGKFPDDMKSFLASDTSYYDLADSKPLRFLPDSTGQTIRLYSIGMNLKDDKGESDLGYLAEKGKDDIWVEVK